MCSRSTTVGSGAEVEAPVPGAISTVTEWAPPPVCETVSNPASACDVTRAPVDLTT